MVEYKGLAFRAQAFALRFVRFGDGRSRAVGHWTIICPISALKREIDGRAFEAIA